MKTSVDKLYYYCIYFFGIYTFCIVGLCILYVFGYVSQVHLQWHIFISYIWLCGFGTFVAVLHTCGIATAMALPTCQYGGSSIHGTYDMPADACIHGMLATVAILSVCVFVMRCWIFLLGFQIFAYFQIEWLCVLVAFQF